MPDSRPVDENLTVTCVWRCGLCSAVCADEAITYGAREVEVNRSGCSRCLVCVMVCPAGILREETFA